MTETNQRWNRAEWEKVHADGYQQQVYSITHEPFLCDLLTDKITALFPEAARVLIPGCGSVGAFEQRLAQRSAADTILCTDFAGVIAHAPQTNNPKIRYEAHDSARLSFHEHFDVIVPINSVVSASDEENKAMLSHFYASLAPGGVMVGFFPTVFCALDIHLNTHDPTLKETMKSVTDTVDVMGIDPAGGVQQIFYTPGALRKRLMDSGFSDVGIDITFFETPYLKKEAERLYGIQEDDVPVYELLVTAKKKHAPR